MGRGQEEAFEKGCLGQQLWRVRGQRQVEGRLRGRAGGAAVSVSIDTWEATTSRERRTF